MESGMSEENGRNPLKKSSINGDQNRPDDITVERSGIPPSLPKRIGQFHIKRLIASGGMGSVYEAVQEHPRRTVAVKVMKQGITSRSALRRFEFESQILARLRHPGIAQIYEAGTHDDGEGGVPYFAMEYIPNARPVTDYAQNRRLDIRRRTSGHKIPYMKILHCQSYHLTRHCSTVQTQQTAGNTWFQYIQGILAYHTEPQHLY